MRKKKCIAMLLAGGQGSRLGFLTKAVAKPAVPFGGKYRIIDFPLSNCAHSGIDTVGVLTQYQPLELNSYIGSGQPWDLDRNEGGVFVLPPYVRGKSGEWYRGTANAIYQNIPFIEQYDPDYVLILSGDHIYKMDYADMLSWHIRNGADATIAVRTVPLSVAHEFGIMSTNSENCITEFEEKPKNPKSDKASMGVYVFTWPVLKQYLIEDEADPNSKNDFGHNIIPKFLADGKRLLAYTFDDYWKDVGTISSLWEANMDLLRDPPDLDLYDTNWRIYARSAVMPPHYTGKDALVEGSMISEGCQVYGTVRSSVLFTGVTVDPGAVVEDSVVMNNVHIGPGCVVRKAIIAEDADLCANCSVGEADGDIALVGAHTSLPEGYSVAPGTQVDNDSLKEAAAK